MNNYLHRLQHHKCLSNIILVHTWIQNKEFDHINTHHEELLAQTSTPSISIQYHISPHMNTKLKTFTTLIHTMKSSQAVAQWQSIQNHISTYMNQSYHTYIIYQNYLNCTTMCMKLSNLHCLSKLLILTCSENKNKPAAILTGNIWGSVSGFSTVFQ